MTGVSAWLDLMPQSVTIEPLSTTPRDLYGNKSYGSATTYRCRIVGKRQQVINAQGQQVLSQQTIYLATPNAVDPESRVTLSTADAGSTDLTAMQPEILATAAFPDESGAHHSVIYL